MNLKNLSFAGALLCLIAWPAAAALADNTSPWTQWQQPTPTIATNQITYSPGRFGHNDELGLRYWYSDSEISYNVSQNPKVSRLDYKIDNSQTGEAYFRLSSANARYLVKGSLGIGGEQNGNVMNYDYNPNGSLGSDTNSTLGKGNLFYAYSDLGYKLDSLSWSQAPTSVTGGLGYLQDVMIARGLTCEQAGSGSIYGPGGTNPSSCTAPGQVPEGSDIKVLQNDAEWATLRIGLDNNYQPTTRLTWRNEIVAVPLAYFYDGDSHYLRPDLGILLPNIMDRGYGYGLQLESLLDYKITPRWSLNIGARFWQFWVPETKTKYVNADIPSSHSYSWSYQRLGAFAGVAYHF